MPADIILLAAIAAFVLLRLRSILGQNVGHDQPPNMSDAVKKDGERVIHLKPVEPQIKDVTPETEPKEPSGTYNDAVEKGIAEIHAIDRQFQMKEFLEGAKGAYDMVHEAFQTDDRDTLKALLAKDIYKEFAEELDKRRKEGEHTTATLVSMLEVSPLEVEVEKNKGRVSVAFTTEQIFVQRDKNGDVVEGSTSDIQSIEDEWTFERDLRSSNPNWTIIAT